jgi:hypothetical protein
MKLKILKNKLNDDTVCLENCCSNLICKLINFKYFSSENKLTSWLFIVLRNYINLRIKSTTVE